MLERWGLRPAEKSNTFVSEIVQLTSDLRLQFATLNAPEQCSSLLVEFFVDGDSLDALYELSPLRMPPCSLHDRVPHNVHECMPR